MGRRGTRSMVRQNRLLVAALLCCGTFVLSQLLAFVGAPTPLERRTSVALRARGGGEYDISDMAGSVCILFGWV